MPADLSASALKVQAALAGFGLGLTVKEFSASTRTAADAAAAIGCTVAQIAKSILFRAVASDRPILVVTSGVNRVSEAKIAGYLGESLGKADAAFVRARTGFVIGGVPPVGHSEAVETFVDEDLMGFDEIWAAAGTPNAVFRLTPADLVRITNGRVVSITER
ncbi:MAG: YbaK/EbsC family protein [Alphaproteobacteria bacterium]